eukprot:gene4598-5740_t
MSQKIVTVFGATGQQGGSVVQQLLKNPSAWKIRAVTRDTKSAKSQELLNRGVELVQLDVTKANAEEVSKGIQGSDSVFLVTDYWSYWNREAEIGKTIVDGVVKANIKHLVYSSLAGVNNITKGAISVPHFDLKFDVKEYAVQQSKKNPSLISSFVYAPFYLQNFLSFSKPKLGDDGVYSFTLPQDPKVPLDVADINDIGPLTEAVLANPTKFVNAEIPFSTRLTGDEIAAKISKFTGKQVKFNSVPTNVYAKFGFPGAEELALMFQYYNEYGTFYGLDTSIAPKLIHVTTLDEFLAKSKFEL